MVNGDPPPAKVIPDDTVFEAAWTHVRTLAVPPVPKPQKGPREVAALEGKLALAKNILMPFALDVAVHIPEIHFDGSFTPARQQREEFVLEKAGYGIAFAFANRMEVTDACGPVTLSTLATQGVRKLSNNVAELVAAITVLQWLADVAWTGPLVLCYDSEYAKKMICGEWSPKHHHKLIAKGKRLWQQIANQPHIDARWKHVDSHCGILLNERADSLADLGAKGEARPLPVDVAMELGRAQQATPCHSMHLQADADEDCFGPGHLDTGWPLED